MPEKLHQNRGVIIGVTVQDAAHHRDQAAEDDVVYLATSHLKSTIGGSVAGLHIRTAYVTPHAPQGLNYETAIEVVQRALARSGGQVVTLSSRD